MELSYKGALDVAMGLKKLLKNEAQKVDIVVCPSFPSVMAVADILKTSDKIQVGVQNIHWEEKGAWTGEVSIAQIKPVAKWCIVGHSERRQHFGETDEHVVHKVQLLLKHGLTSIVCVGETAQERADGNAFTKVTQQVRILLNEVSLMDLSHIVIAYEPIWAIGSGHTPLADEAAEIMLLIRKLVSEKFGPEGVERLRVLYGGSVTPDTVVPFVTEPGIDGVLVGGASVRPLQLLEIIQQYAQ